MKPTPKDFASRQAPLRNTFRVIVTTPAVVYLFPVRQGRPREMSIHEFQKMALEIPTAVERSHMHHPDFRVAGKIFASMGVPDENWGMVKLTPSQQRTFIKKTPEVFKPASGAWGRQGCTSVYLPAAKADVVRAALGAAAENVINKKRTRAPNA